MTNRHFGTPQADGEVLGFLAREMAAQYSPVLRQRGQPYECRVRIEKLALGGPGSEQYEFQAVFTKPLPSPAELGC